MLKNYMEEKDRGIKESGALESLNPRFRDSIIFIFFFLFVLTFFPSHLQSTTDYPDKDCLKCHEKPELSQTLKNGHTRSIYVDPSKWNQDIHFKSGMTCVDCHTQAAPSLHIREGFRNVNCAHCHPEEEEEFTKNIHFEYGNVSPGKVLPQCYDCHTKHFVLLHDHPESSVHEANIGKTCGICHAEIQVRGILKGTSLGKISGHRKGDLSEKFDMNVCISCHYADSAHGPKRAFKEYCSRCHDVRKKTKANGILGPIHIDSVRWAGFNYIGSGLFIFSLFGLGLFFCVRTRKKFHQKIIDWINSMKIVSSQDETASKTNQDEGEESS
ncbi:hypothetical protein ACFLRX_04370 [Acidobacteriota bacterium]